MILKLILLRPTASLLLCLVIFIAQGSAASSSWVKPEDGLTGREKLDFWTSFSLFRNPWVAAPASTTGRDGLGPLFNARSCAACHKNGSHGKLPEYGPGLVVRLGEFNAKTAVATPLLDYGNQLQTLSITSMIDSKTIPAEASLKLEWQEQEVTRGNTILKLKKPIPIIENLAYGPLPQNTRLSLRLAPPLFGLGLLEKIPKEVLLAQVDENDSNKDGISGKAAKVWSIEQGQWAIGRFGYKAEQATLLQQTAAAFQNDIGLSSWLYPMQNCTAKQAACQQAATGNSKQEGVEISRQKLQMTAHFVQQLKRSSSAVLNKQDRENTDKGKQVFNSIGCSNCHTPTYDITGNANKIMSITPYSDLLLHDMGAELSDNKPVNNASGDEWRTTPLWGIRLKLAKENVTLLHDGRASSIKEAIGWHGGEAKQAANRYFLLKQQERYKLDLFISNL